MTKKSEKQQPEEDLQQDLAGQATENAEEAPRQEEVEPTAEERAAALQDELAQLNDTYLRHRAEFENYRKRTLVEKAELIKNGGEKVLVSLLPVVDDFERGLNALEKADSIEGMKEGLHLIYDKLQAFLAQNGVKAMDTEAQAFDTDLHEAVTTIPAPDESLKGKVVDCIQKGYYLNEKVIRYAKVVVGQ